MDRNLLKENITEAFKIALEEKDSTVFYGSQYDADDPSEKQKKRYSDVEVHRDRKDGTTRRKTFSGKRAKGIRKALAARLPNLDPDSRKRKNPGSASHDDETMDMTDRNVATVHNRTEGNELKKRFPKREDSSIKFKEQIKNAVLNYLGEGPTTGGNTTATATRVGKFLQKQKNRTPEKLAQADRIASRMSQERGHPGTGDDKEKYRFNKKVAKVAGSEGKPLKQPRGKTPPRPSRKPNEDGF